MTHIRKVAITGGTHGNELTGVYLINKFQANPALVERKSFKTMCMHTNPGAIRRCTRYIDKDLNRTFTLDSLKDFTLESYEDVLAKVINQQLGPKGSPDPAVDFVIDLHTTTSDMGLSIVLSSDDPLTWQVAAYVQSHIPQLNLFRWKGDTNDASFVNSIAPHGFAIEVGSIPQGVLKASLFFDTEKIIQTILDYIDLLNQGEAPYFSEVEIYDHVKLIDFPRDNNGEISAMLHPSLQDNGYAMIKQGDPIFITMDGEEICYHESTPRYALFANEAAYYEKFFAMSLSDKKSISLPPLSQG